jgi:hypothetical protein
LFFKPALQRALSGQVRPRMLALQQDTNQPTSPGGVFAAQGNGLVVQGIVGRGPGAATGLVARREDFAPVLTEALE